MSAKTTFIIAIVFWIVAACIIVPKMCPKTMNNLRDNLFPKKIETPSVENLRFQKVETFVFDKGRRGTATGVIYEDTKTGIEYLYIMSSAPNGGPCITRLWEK